MSDLFTNSFQSKILELEDSDTEDNFEQFEPVLSRAEEAFIKVLQMHGIEHSFGIIGSAFMAISDLFPKAGITFWDVAH